MQSGLYFHIPFCAKRCPYCDFAFVVRKNPPFARFTDALLGELASARPPAPETIYFGGGTPSLLPPHEMERILEAIVIKTGAELTLEANPEDIDALSALSRLGINRLSLGVQALDDRILQTLGRIHDARAARAAVTEAVRLVGNVSADLIFGIPDLRTEKLLDAARFLIGEGVSHLSAYGLTVHEGTRLAKDLRQGSFKPVTDELERTQFLALHEFLTAAGFEHYEVSNYALPGARSRHNESYWQGKTYRGLGPSAHSFDARGQRRYWNERRLDRWMELIEAGQSPIAGEETLRDEALRIEALYLGLRRSEGVAKSLLASFPRADEKMEKAVREGLAKQTGERIYLTPEGMAVADTLVHHLL